VTHQDEPHTRTILGSHTFMVAVLKLLKSLPNSVCSVNSQHNI